MTMSEHGPKFISLGTPDFAVQLSRVKKAKNNVIPGLWNEHLTRLESTGDHDPYSGWGEINKKHGVRFIEDIIPQKIKTLRENGEKRNLRVLDLGCGFGFFGDQIRHSGVEAKVYGTTIKHPSKSKKDAKEALLADLQARNQIKILKKLHGQLKDKQGRNDRITQSILELHNFPEFDLIIETFGELFYAGLDDQEKNDTESSLFTQHLEAAIKKLMTGGELYISNLPFCSVKYLWDNYELLEKKLGITINLVGGYTKEQLKILLSDTNPLDNIDSKIEVLYRSKDKEQKEQIQILQDLKMGRRILIKKNE